MAGSERVRFKINGLEHSVGSEVSSDVSLLDYVRDTAGLRGTKYMCREAGCGACIISAVTTSGAAPVSVNSCMVSVTSCHNWEVTTIEKVGNRRDGYHPIQKTLAAMNGTQCGYCTPGWVMSMYSLLLSRKNLTMLEIEKSFASNVCRCTGYRPILEAFKKFAKDAHDRQEIPDIEDLYICEKTGKMCKSKCTDEDIDWCFINEEDVKAPKVTEILLKDGKRWFRVQEIDDILKILKARGNDSYMLVAGNTAKGAYPISEYPRVLIDISGVSELKGYIIDQNLVIGAGTTLTEFINICQNLSKEDYFKYLETFYDHLNLVAHIAVRNIGTIAGNLMTKHQHNDFPSDVFLLLETVGAYVTILNCKGTRRTVSMQQFLKTNMEGKVLLNVSLPPLNDCCRVVTFKIMPKAQNAHAIVNAGFLYKFYINMKTVRTARIVFGGLSPDFVRATDTEVYLSGKTLFSNNTLQLALNIMKKELIVTENLPEPPAAYRKQLALALFYKGLLSLCPKEILNTRYQLGATKLRESRTISNGRQIFDTKPRLWPLTKPIPKLEALIQCSGEASYTEDLPSFQNEVYAAFVLSTVAIGNIISMDTNKALKEPGVIAIYTVKDIPGNNAFTPIDSQNIMNEEVLSNGEIKYYNQPIAIVVAESRAIADRAANMVTVSYGSVKKPSVDIKDTKKDPNKTQFYRSTNAVDKGNDIKKVFKHSNTIYGQYHFTMETLVCITRPVDDGLEVYSTSQQLDAVQQMISEALNVDQNRIDVYVRRLGGGYGFKISRNTQVAVACSLVAFKLNRPCRFIQSLTTNMKAMGKRFPCSADFEVGVNNKGVIQHMNFDIFEDNGYTINELLTDFGAEIYNTCYDASRWDYKCYQGTTDTAKNTYCRSPGTLETISMVEGVMERISYELSLDPAEVRLSNLDLKNHSPLIEMVESVKRYADYTVRKQAVNQFNIENRWKKRGFRFSFLRWRHIQPRTYDVNIAVYHGDGSIIITHGGVEMGQGINTKAAQVCAYFLNVPLEKVQVKGSNTIAAPNSAVDGGSITTQNVIVGVQLACQELLKRLEPIINTKKDATWEEIIRQAYTSNIDLQAHGFAGPNIQNYNVYGVTLAEVEVDILTGEAVVLRVDILQDAGQSISPEIDVGQVEGAFIMGLGYWMTENLVYDHKTGELLTDRTWNYYVPQARDVPQDFRVYLRKNSYSTKIVLGSKGIGEPPMCMAIAIPFAIREAIASARQDAGIPTTTWFDIDGPFTADKVCMSAATKPEDFKLY